MDMAKETDPERITERLVDLGRPVLEALGNEAFTKLTELNVEEIRTLFDFLLELLLVIQKDPLYQKKRLLLEDSLRNLLQAIGETKP